jgi:NAD(P)-dependent dehydrogenase (short-subunit alcohol dehydrogenase family)
MAKFQEISGDRPSDHDMLGGIRIGRPGEVARLVAFLASKGAAYVSDITFALDGRRPIPTVRESKWDAAAIARKEK